jgi:hypothetical protein
VVLRHLRSTHSITLTDLPTPHCDRLIRDAIHRVRVGVGTVHIELDDSVLPALVAEARTLEEVTRTEERSAAPADLDAPIPTLVSTAGVSTAAGHTLLALTVDLKRRPGRPHVTTAAGETITVAAPPRRHHKDHIIHAIGQAFAWHEDLLNSTSSMADFAKRIGVSEARLNAVLSLTQLSPTLIAKALRGELPPTTALDDLLTAAKRLDWSRQVI